MFGFLFCQTKISLTGIDQTTSEGGLFDSTAERKKTLIVWMKSLASGTRGLTVYDSGELVYRFDNYHGKHSPEVRLYNPLGEVVFTICRKVNKLKSK